MKGLLAQQRAFAPSSSVKIAKGVANAVHTAHSTRNHILHTRKQHTITRMSAYRNQSDVQPDAPSAIFHRLLATPLPQQDNTSIAIMCVLGSSYVLSFMDPPSAIAASSPHDIHAVAQPIADISENTDFWANVLRYVSYFFSVLLGTAFTILRPLANLMKNPLTAVLVIAGAAALYFFVSTTVQAMLGLNDIIEYEPSSIVTPNVQ